MARRARRSGFGCVISTGTTTHPAFVIRWWEGSRRKQKSGFRTRTEAGEALARVRTGLGDGTLVEKRRADVGFDEVAKQWLTLHSASQLRSHSHNVGRFKSHLEPFFGDSPLRAIDPARILALREKLRGEGYAARTVNLVLALLRSILKFAAVNGHIAASPTDRLGRGRFLLPLEKTKLAPPVERPEEVGRLLTAVAEIGRETNRPWLYPFFALLSYTGLRFGEAIALQWRDVDLSRRLVTIRRSWEGPTKGGKERLVPIAEELAPILAEHRLADPWKGALVFPSPDARMFTHGSVTSWKVALWAACDRAGLRRIRIHDLRHVFASHFVMMGGDIFALQRILGHSTPTLTSDTYAHLANGYLSGAADRVRYPAPPALAKVISIGASVEPTTDVIPESKYVDSTRGAPTGSQPPDAFPNDYVVPRDRIELSTQGFSVGRGEGNGGERGGNVDGDAGTEGSGKGGREPR